MFSLVPRQFRVFPKGRPVARSERGRDARGRDACAVAPPVEAAISDGTENQAREEGVRGTGRAWMRGTLVVLAGLATAALAAATPGWAQDAANYPNRPI